MIVSVAMNARGVRSVESRVCIMLDVLRASSTMLAMFQAGAREIFLAETPGAALEMAKGRGDKPLVCGERHGLKVAGFDFGNSPVEVAEADLSGREVVYVTSNGTNALRAAAGASVVLVGSPRNEVAAVRQATREATARGCNVLILCAGDQGGFGVSLEDAFFAGMLVERFVRLSPRRVAPEEAAHHPDALALDDSAIVAHRLYRSYLAPGDGHATSQTLLSVFAEARSGRDLPAKGFSADLEYCSQIDVTTAVPRLDVRDGTLAVVAQGSGEPHHPD